MTTNDSEVSPEKFKSISKKDYYIKANLLCSETSCYPGFHYIHAYKLNLPEKLK